MKKTTHTLKGALSMMLILALILGAAPAISALAAEEPSPWAQKGVAEATEAGFVPEHMQNNYGHDTTREGSHIAVGNQNDYLFSDDDEPVFLLYIMPLDPAAVKREYYDGETLDLTGLRMIGVYSDFSEEEINDFTVNPPHGTLLSCPEDDIDGVIVQVTITHIEGELPYSFDFNITVFPATVTGISVLTQPAKLIYTEGQPLDLDGLSVTLAYNSGVAKTVEFADFTLYGITTDPISGSTLSLAQNNTAVTVSCNGYTAAANAITVNRELITITYNANNGSGTMQNGTAEKGGAYTVASNGFTRSGYTFNGWNTQANGAGTAYTAGSVINDVQEDITLYAQWNQSGDGGGGGGGSGNDAGDEEETAEEATIEELGVALGEFEDWGNPFTDVKEGDWFYDAVRYANTNGLMNGISEDLFSPNMAVTRVMIVTILWRLEGSPDLNEQWIQDNGQFTDVAEGAWYYIAVLWAQANGIVEGYGDGRFGPNNSITREQFAAILYRYAYMKDSVTSVTTDLSEYTDAGQISGYAEAPMKWANATGLITGRSADTLVPGGSATRAEAAVILMRLIENIVNT